MNKTQLFLTFFAVAAINGSAPAFGEEGHEAGHTDEIKLTAAAIKRSGIKVDAARPRRLARSVTAPARIAFNRERIAHVGSVVSGRVAELKARVGDKVKKWDPLLVIESPELGRAQSELLQRFTEANVAASAVQPAKDAYDRARKLFDESQGLSLSEVQKREAEYRIAVGNAASTKASLRAAENTLYLFGFTGENVRQLVETSEINPRFVIRSPIDGEVTEREVTLGELVSPDKEQLLTIANTSNYWVLADVPEARLGDIGIGSAAEVQVAAFPDHAIAGEISLVSSEIDSATRTARLRIVVDNQNGTLRPGMFARVVIESRRGDEVIAVPEDAVQTVEGKTSVFVPVPGEANTFARREVMVGPPANSYVQVFEGLKANDEVVVAGSFILKAELGKSEAGHDH